MYTVIKTVCSMHVCVYTVIKDNLDLEKEIRRLVRKTVGSFSFPL